MRDDDLAKEFIFRVLVSRTRGEGHLERGSLAGLSICQLIDSVVTLLEKEPHHLSISGSVVVVGDLHGSIDDLLRIFERFSYPPSQTYLFLGDYVDRGENSIEVLLILYSLKLLFPDHVFLLRGNHECALISRCYGFRDECVRFFKTKRVYHRFCGSFSHLPLAATVNGEVFCVHGGLSPSISFLDDIAQIKKPLKDVSSSIAEDLLWSDPMDGVDGFDESPRRVGFLFGRPQVEQFLADNGLTLMIRAHEFCPRGSEEKVEGCLTVFSACDYCGQGNDGAVAILKKGEKPEVSIFEFEPGKRRRFLFPEWVLENTVFLKAPVIHEPEGIADVKLDVVMC